MKKIGITGGLGSGKSTVCRIFELLGVPVYYADEASKKLLEDPAVIRQVTGLFGTAILDENGFVNRKALASVVFGDQHKLSQLNGIMHPAVARHFESWLRLQNHPAYVLKEAAILFESGSYRQMDKVIVVSAPQEIRISRVQQRDGMSHEQIMGRLSAQLAEEERIARADFIIANDEQQLVIPQVLEIHRKLS